MSKKYQVTELDKVLEQFKGIDEWTDEKQKDWELKRKVESLTSQLEKVNTKKVELYTDNILLKREIEELKRQIQKGMKFIQKDLSEIFSLNTELDEYRKLKSECHKDIEKVWMYDNSYGLDDKQTIDRDSCIERVFYKIGNQWID
jgi:chromosome segregation ATPase